MCDIGHRYMLDFLELCKVNWVKNISTSFLVIMISISVFNAYQVVSFAINQEQIEEELCINKDTDITECNGLCYLADQVITEPSPVNQDLQLAKVNTNLNFMFYFFNVQEEVQYFVFNHQKRWFEHFTKELTGHKDIVVPPPSYC